jgi:hypothetical protein
MTALPSAFGFSGTASVAARRVAPALADAARRTGVPFEALFNTARLESGFNPEARARTSSATGLFQFIDSTWLDTLARHGARHGLNPASRAEALDLRRDPVAASLMAAAHMADNAAALAGRTGQQPGQVELYLAHFLGVGGAARFLDGLAAQPDRSAAALMPAAARANRAIFFADGRSRSLSEVHDLLARKLGAAPAQPGDRAPAEALPAMQLAAMAPSEQSPGSAALSSDALQPAVPQSAALQSARLAYLLLADLGA